MHIDVFWYIVVTQGRILSETYEVQVKFLLIWSTMPWNVQGTWR